MLVSMKRAFPNFRIFRTGACVKFTHCECLAASAAPSLQLVAAWKRISPAEDYGRIPLRSALRRLPVPATVYHGRYCSRHWLSVTEFRRLSFSNAVPVTEFKPLSSTATSHWVIVRSLAAWYNPLSNPLERAEHSSWYRLHSNCVLSESSLPK